MTDRPQYIPITPRFSGRAKQQWKTVHARLVAPGSDRQAILEEGTASQNKPGVRVLCSVLLDLQRSHFRLRPRGGVLHVRPLDIEDFRGRELVHRQHQANILATEKAVKLGAPYNQHLFNLFLESEGAPAPLKAFLADPERLRARLELGPDDPHAIHPYLQEANPGIIDAATGFDLHDVWNVLRLTWRSPYNSTPGRSVHFLVRDAGDPTHPVIGLLAFSSPIIQLTVRDDWIGWTLPAIDRWLEQTNQHNVKKRRRRANHLVARLDRTLQTAIAEIKRTGLGIDGLSDQQAIAVLRAKKRPISQMPRLKADPSKYAVWCDHPVIRYKRATTLLQLLEARCALENGRARSGLRTLQVWTSKSPTRRALARVLAECKRRDLNTSIMDMTTCGAIAPYNEVLGGKLVTMLACHPEVRASFKQRYEGQAGIIASVMAGRPIGRTVNLQAVITTSLYESHAIQYDRVSVAGAKSNAKLQRLGKTRGFTPIHFSGRTRSLARNYMASTKRGAAGTSFGSGVNPSLRLMGGLLQHLSISKDILDARSRRIVFGLPLVQDLRSSLLEAGERPRWVIRDRDGGLIAVHWWNRWIRARLPTLLAKEMPDPYKQVVAAIAGATPGSGPPLSPEEDGMDPPTGLREKVVLRTAARPRVPA